MTQKRDYMVKELKTSADMLKENLNKQFENCC